MILKEKYVQLNKNANIMIISCKTCKSLEFKANVSHIRIMHVKNVSEGNSVRRRCEIQRSDCSFDYAVLRSLMRQR